MLRVIYNLEVSFNTSVIDINFEYLQMNI